MTEVWRWDHSGYKMPDWLRDWVPAISLLALLVGIIITLLKTSPIVPATRILTLRQTIADQGVLITNQGAEIVRLTERVDRQTAEIVKLTQRVEYLLGDNEYWRQKYQEADRRRPPRQPP